MEVRNLLEQCCALKEDLTHTSQHQELLASQAMMLNDEYVQLLIQYFQTAQSFYNDALRFNAESKNELARKLSQAKTVLYSHPLVKKYLADLDNFNHLLDQVSSHIFGSLYIDNPHLSVHFRQAKHGQTEE